MSDAAPPDTCPTEGVGEVFDKDTFAFGDDSFRGEEPGLTSQLLVDRSSSAAIAAALDLGDEAIKGAFYDVTAADATKYSDAVSGIGPSSAGSEPSPSATWSVPSRVPSRLPNVIIRETSNLRGRFSFPIDRGPSPTLFGGSNVLPCTDDLLGRGVSDSGINNFGFDNDHFFGLDYVPGEASSSAAAARPRSRSEEGFPQQKRYRLGCKQGVPGL